MSGANWIKDALRDEHGRIIGRKKEHEAQEAGGVSEGAPAAVGEVAQSEAPQGEATDAGTAAIAGIGAERAGIERELVVIGKCANPRLIRCWYMELASRRTCLVDVKRNAKWLPRMRFVMIEPADEEAYRRPWVYTGRQPRLRGRW